MKLLPVLFLLCCFGTGCAAEMQPTVPPNLCGGLEAAVTLQGGVPEAQAVLTRDPLGQTSLSFTAPETVAGLTLQQREGTVLLQFEELSAEYPPEALPQAALLFCLDRCLDALCTQNITAAAQEQLLLLSGETSDGSFCLCYDTACEQPLSLQAGALSLTFQTFSVLPSAPSNSAAETGSAAFLCQNTAVQQRNGRPVPSAGNRMAGRRFRLPAGHGTGQHVGGASVSPA